MPQQAPRILILDDEEAIRSVLMRALERLGYQLDLAGSAIEALTLLSNWNYDLLICDIQMPGLSGLDFYRELEINYPSLTNRVVFMSGDTVDSEVQDFLDGVNASVLKKPFDLAGLYREVSKILK